MNAKEAKELVKDMRLRTFHVPEPGCKAEGYIESHEKAKELAEVLRIIPGNKLVALAKWIAIKFPDDGNSEVQDDLERMGIASKEALAKWEEEG